MWPPTRPPQTPRGSTFPCPPPPSLQGQLPGSRSQLCLHQTNRSPFPAMLEQENNVVHTHAQPLPTHFPRGLFSSARQTPRPPKGGFPGHAEGQARTGLRQVLKLHHHAATGLRHKEEPSASSKIAKMQKAFVKRRQTQSYIYLARDSPPKLRLVNSPPLIFPRARKSCKKSGSVSSTAQARRCPGMQMARDMLKVK